MQETLRVFDHRLWRGVFDPKEGEVMRVWKRLHNKELDNLYSPSNVIRIVEQKWMRRTGNATCMAGKRSACRLFDENMKEMGRLEGRNMDGG
jgi:hypothetical protein